MKSAKKGLLLTVCALALVVASVFGTLAYLTSEDTVTNTFTVGKVAINLDEALANPDGTLVDNGVTRVKENSYKLLPGHTYNKDPMVTVLKDSEASYVRMTLTITKSAELSAIFADMLGIFDGYVADTWINKGFADDAINNTRTYTFWYKDKVAATNADTTLAPLFEQIVMPGTLTNAQLATIEGMEIIVKAEAIQADGFENAEAAFNALDDQNS